MKIQFFALFFAAQSSLLCMDRAVAMDTSETQPGVSSPGTEPVDAITPNTSTLDKKAVAHVRSPVKQPVKQPLKQPLKPLVRPLVKPELQPSFSAYYRLQHRPSKTVLDEARVLYSEAGMRVEQLNDQSANVFIANHMEDKYWFVDRSRQVFHVIPVVVSQYESQPLDESQSLATTGFIQLTPCSGLDGKTDGTALWQGRPVQHWTCMKLGERVEEQWYAPIPGVVVRSLTGDGYVSELTDLRNRQFSSLDFQPPSHYRQVTIEELMNPSMPIGMYTE